MLATENDVLINLALAIPEGEEIVQIGASIIYAAAWQDVEPDQMEGYRVGMLHLGPGRFAELEDWAPRLVRGAIVTIEECALDSEAYHFAVDLTARGWLTATSEAKHWRNLCVSTYLGKG